MRTLLSIIWFVFSGFWLWLAYMLAGIICCVLIITIPWGIASFGWRTTPPGHSVAS